MALPFFYIDQFDPAQKEMVLGEDTSKHIVQVLRMKVGSQLNLTDGKGNLITCVIMNDHKKQCVVEVKVTKHQQQGAQKISVAISLLKNTNRFEWFLEKATEIGVNEIIPLICERTEKEKFRQERLQGICSSAMLQSQQVWLPDLQEPVLFQEFIKGSAAGIKFIAHCIENDKKQLSHLLTMSRGQTGSSSQGVPWTNCQICIGPEGDFTNKEIEWALANKFIPVSLGETRLRTETAGIVAATLLCQV